jgi:16S rRNA processing protein RimM
MNLSENKIELKTGSPENAGSPKNAGSPAPGEPVVFGEPVFLAVGKLRRPHGVRGEFWMDVLTDFPERLKPGVTVFAGENHQVLHISRCRSHGSSLLVTFEELSDPEMAGVLRNEFLYVRSEDIPHLPEGEYYHHQILGLRVVGEKGEGLGRVVDILETGANDVCVVRQDSGAEFLLPIVDSTVLEIDLDKGFMRVHLLEGLIESRE